MWFERIVSEGLAHNSWIFGTGSVAAVVDPRRDCEAYLDLARQHDAVITHIFETHRNEDYVTGGPELAARSGAQIFHGARMAFRFGTPVRDGDRFMLGTLAVRILETPGHTEESITIVVADTGVSDEPYLVFSGDTLFSGDIARTDFFGEERKAEMAAVIHDSITKKILPLGKGAILCPAHGAGSVCGGDIADLPISTLGFEEQTNPQLLTTKDEFVAKRVTESPYQPPYFRQMEQLNQDGPALLGSVPVTRPLQPAEVQEMIRSSCQLVDIRSPTAFAGGHIPGSISIWREGLPAFAGWVLDYSRPIVVIDDFNCEIPRALPHFVRLGFDNVTGWLAGGFPAWFRAALPVERTGTCTVQELFQKLGDKDLFLLDVRDIKKRMAQGHIPGSHHIYVGEFPEHINEIPKDRPIYVYCDAGYKGSLAASLLAMRGYDKVTNVLGGIQAWLRAGFPTGHP